MPHYRDPVHGFIEINEQEQKIVDSPPFQRLRNIRQLATTYLVYHGAEHTRFGHSLGVMHLVTRTFDSITKKIPCLFRDDPEENDAVVQWYRQILRLIALTHDLGHAPFSHASETLFPKGRGHEDYTRDIIEQTEIAGYISEIGAGLQKKLGEQYKITPELLWMIYGENPEKHILDDDYIMPDFMFLRSLMDGEMDCDKMDYLLRDSKFCGVSYGKYDLDRFISSLTVYKDPDENIMQLAIEKGGLQSFEEFVLARYFMFIQVYFHRTRRYFDHLLGECLKEILPGGKYPEDVGEYLKWDDVEVLHAMKNKKSPCTDRYLRRQTMTCVRETSAHADRKEDKIFNIVCRAIKSGLGTGAVWTDKVDKAAHKLQPVLWEPNDDSGREIRVVDKHSGRSINIMEESLILESIAKPIRIDRLYVKKEDAPRAGAIIKSTCGE